MAINNNHLVIMAGGVGSRFWPMSTEERPKQFIDVLGSGRTLLQSTYDRFKGVIPPGNVWVVTNRRYSGLVSSQLPDIPEGNILLEPCRRNTAPCVCYVSWRIKAQDPKANIVVAPSDHLITDVVEFQRIIKECLNDCLSVLMSWGSFSEVMILHQCLLQCSLLHKTIRHISYSRLSFLIINKDK